jgi:hypothetical protein
MRELDEVRDFEHAVERLHQIGVSALGEGLIPHDMRRGRRVEIVVVAAQALQRCEIFEVIDRSEHLAEPAEFVARLAADEGAVFDEGVEDVALAHRNEPVAAAGREL